MSHQYQECIINHTQISAKNGIVIRARNKNGFYTAYCLENLQMLTQLPYCPITTATECEYVQLSRLSKKVAKRICHTYTTEELRHVLSDLEREGIIDFQPATFTGARALPLVQPARPRFFSTPLRGVLIGGLTAVAAAGAIKAGRLYIGHPDDPAWTAREIQYVICSMALGLKCWHDGIDNGGAFDYFGLMNAAALVANAVMKSGDDANRQASLGFR
jgi:hypothetical protein